ncbi:hypothetical protein SOVF_131990 [Spinacia oleracea]|nr:hypothetical protein SOVF_131990 [Spinacia oleracea]
MLRAVYDVLLMQQCHPEMRGECSCHDVLKSGLHHRAGPTTQVRKAEAMLRGRV